MSETQIMQSVRKYWDVTWEEWLSAGWWVRDSPLYGTLLGLWTYHNLMYTVTNKAE